MDLVSGLQHAPNEITYGIAHIKGKFGPLADTSFLL